MVAVAHLLVSHVFSVLVGVLAVLAVYGPLPNPLRASSSSSSWTVPPSSPLPAAAIAVGHEVEQALRAGLPVVALESTVITHGGMPFPKNLQTALELEAIVRSGGAVPCTIAILKGSVVLGNRAGKL